MRIIIASTRTPKINGVKNAVRQLAAVYHFNEQEILYETKQVNSGVSHTPSTVDEVMLGARQRAIAAFPPETGSPVLSIGVEGGLFTAGEKVFLQSWSCVFDGTAFHFGSSGAVELPETLAGDVLHRGIELGVAIDSFSRQSDVRSGAGTFGILTRDMISREDSFKESTLLALTPFFNSTLYAGR